MYVYIYNMVKRTTTSTSGEYTSDPLKQYKDWRKTKGNNSYLEFTRENPDPNVSERFEGLPRENTKKPTEGEKRRKKTITKSKSKKNKSKKNRSKKSKK